jgi:hypothetical protein
VDRERSARAGVTARWCSADGADSDAPLAPTERNTPRATPTVTEIPVAVCYATAKSKPQNYTNIIEALSKVISNKHTYIKSHPFPIGVDRDNFFPRDPYTYISLLRPPKSSFRFSRQIWNKSASKFFIFV